MPSGRNLSIRLATISTLAILNSSVCLGADPPQPKKQTPPSLEDAYRSWIKGFSSTNKADHQKTLAAMQPTKRDIEQLFPKHAEKLWPMCENGNKFLLKNVDRIAKEMTVGGEVTKFTAVDIRRDKEPTAKRFQRILAMIPQDVPVLRIVVEQRGKAAGGSTYLYLNKRWIWINGFEELPDILDQLK